MTWLLVGLLALGLAEPNGGAAERENSRWRDAAPALPYDPFCTTTNNGPVIPRRPLPQSTQRMIELLAKAAESKEPDPLGYLNDRLLRELQEKLAQTIDLREQIALRLRIGNQFTLGGDPSSALREFDSIDASMTKLGGKLGGTRGAEMRLNRAVALLRLGEQENCLTNHNPVSCLFPIRPEGRHQFQRGSRGAIELLAEQLTITPKDLRARWLLNLAYMTVGEWPERVPAPWVIPPEVFASEYPLPAFTDVAGSLGLDVDDLAGGVILEDFDLDGFLDIVASSWGVKGQLRFFHNDGNGHWTERTAEAGFLGLFGGLNLQQTDYNNDGWPDIWILRGAWLGAAGRFPKSLLRNNRDGTFTDVTEECGLLSFHPSQTSAWIDYDGDGWLDVFIGNETWQMNNPDRCELFHNNGDGTFTEVAAETGLAVARLVKGVAAADYDHDGRPDLFLSCREGGPNLLFHNEGPATNAQGKATWRFREVAKDAGVGESLRSFPTWFFDYDNDGNDDLFASGYQIRDVGDVAADYLGTRHTAALPRLYRNLGNGTFTNVTTAVHLNRVCLAMGSDFGDVDNDGWLDFYLGTGDPDFTTLIPNRMFRNDRGQRFQEVTTAAGVGHLQKGHAVAFGDLDNDGDQDIYHVVGGAYTGDRYPNALFLNPGNGNHWLKLQCVGTRSNRAAIGTRIRVVLATPEGPRSIYKTVNSGGSFGSGPLRQELGLGNATAITQVDLEWPASGQRQTFAGLSLDHAYRLTEGDTHAVTLQLTALRFDTNAPSSHRHVSMLPAAH